MVNGRASVKMKYFKNYGQWLDSHLFVTLPMYMAHSQGSTTFRLVTFTIQPYNMNIQNHYSTIICLYLSLGCPTIIFPVHISA